MSILIKGGIEMPKACFACIFLDAEHWKCRVCGNASHGADCRPTDCPLVELPTPHGDLIDRDALIKDGWLNLHKEVMRMGGYAIHELPLKNPSIAVIIPAEEEKV